MVTVYYFFTSSSDFDINLFETEIKKMYHNGTLTKKENNQWVLELNIPKDEYNADCIDKFTDFHVGTFIKKYCNSDGIEKIIRSTY